MSFPYKVPAAILAVVFCCDLPAAAPSLDPAATSTIAAPVATSVPYDPRSTPAAPCGIGVAPPGHSPPELQATSTGIILTVKQDASRLCYVENGNADAPIIRVRRGADLSVTLNNEITDPAAIDAVTASGKLGIANEAVPESPGYYKVLPGMRHRATGATNLHVHGFAVPPAAPQDDVLTVCTDPASGSAGCGRRSFTYHYRLPTDMSEGLYWYHPHVHGEVQAQMLMGLSGAIVVEGPEDDARHAAGIDDRVLIIRQTQDQDAGKTPVASMTAAPATTSNKSTHKLRHLTANAVDTAHELLCTTNSGIDEISLNGTPILLGDAPDAALASYSIKAGGKQLWRILNAATDAFLDLSIVDQNGKALAVEVVARDGSPLADDSGRPQIPPPTTEAQMVPPSGRLEMLVSAPLPGVKAYLVTHAVDSGCAGDRLPERRLAVITATAPATPPAAAISAAFPPPVSSVSPSPSASASSALPAPLPMCSAAMNYSSRLSLSPVSRASLFSGLLARHTDRQRVIAMAEYPRPGENDQTDFYLFERKPGAVLKPYMMGDAPAITVKSGTTEEWVIENWTNELHTFHIHQLHFRLLEVDGEPIDNPPLLDVVEVPYASANGYHSKEGPVHPGRIRIKMEFPASLAGDIPFHCHLVDHEDNGMMAVLRILPRAGQHPAGSNSTEKMQPMPQSHH
jgi:FtsP/CotA-like multicopper oxidase with cupredoxin domain